MILVRDIYKYIDEIAPFSLQAGYDNSGLIVGNAYYGVDEEIRERLQAKLMRAVLTFKAD